MDDELPEGDDEAVEVTSATKKPKKRGPVLSGWCMTDRSAFCRWEPCEGTASDHRSSVEPRTEPTISPAMQELIRRYYP